MKEKLLNIIKNRNFYYVIVIFLIFLLTAVDMKEKLTSKGITSNNYVFALLVTGVIISIFFFLIIYLFKQKKTKPHIIFLILALSFGTMYLLASPLFTGSDEHNHYYRIYEITQGNFTTPINGKFVGDKLPASLSETFVGNDEERINRNTRIKYKDELEMSKKSLNKNEKTQYGKEYATEYSNTALYCPLQYFPQVIGFMIGELFNLGPFWLGQLGRIFNLLCYVLIGTYFLKKLPRLKTFAMLILLSPVLLANATTLSADAFTNVLVFGLITTIICHRYEKTIISKKEKLLLFTLSVLLASCKIVYLPLIFLLFLIPKDCYKSICEKRIFTGICIVFGFVISLVWMRFTDIYFDVYYINTETQKMNILSNILGYFVVVLRTYMSEFSRLLSDVFVGYNMYHSQLPVYNFISISYIVIVFLSFFIKEKSAKYKSTMLNFKENTLVGIIMLIVLALITTAIYIQCTANFVGIDNSLIEGLQGRYYLPFFLCVLLIGSKKNIKFQLADNNVLLESSLLIHLYVLLQMVVCFIV